jgi:hypothetical protein
VASACVDADARAAVERLRREVALNEAAQRVSALPPGVLPPGAPGAPPAAPLAAEGRVPVGEFRRYARIETSNPNVTVAQRQDGSYDVKTSDPSLAGTVLPVKAISSDGYEDTILIRIPP